MKKVVFLGGLSTDDNSTRTPYAEQFSKVLADYEIDSLFFDDLLFHITPGKFSITDKKGQELSDYDLVILRGRIRPNAGLAYIVSRYLIGKKVKFFNDYSLYRPPSKLAQSALFYELEIPFIETVFSLDKKRVLQAAERNFKFPLILKDNYGSHGDNNFLIQKQNELKEKLAQTEDLQLIMQTFHPNDCDYRVLILGEHDPLVIKRMATSGSHLNNTSQGAKAELSMLPGAYLEQSKDLAKKLGMTIAGIDILEDKETKEVLFLEVNSQPQLLTGVFVNQKKQSVAELIKSLI